MNNLKADRLLVHVDGKTEELSARMATFCELYVSGKNMGNASAAYREAYGNDHPSCNVKAYHLLRKPKIQQRIKDLIAMQGYNPMYVAKRHLDLINSADEQVALGAVKEYHKVTGAHRNVTEIIHTKSELSEERRQELNQLLYGHESGQKGGGPDEEDE